MEPTYLSADASRVAVRSEDDLRRLASAGLLEETHYLDLKGELGRNNKEIARDLASFAVDGGTIIVGVAELDGGGLELTPQPLAGLPERVEQIAGSIPDPPLAVLTHTVAAADDTSVGYLIVQVPASSQAPHMVEHRYLARGDKAKRYLEDPEVRRLHTARRHDLDDGLRLLDREMERDPFAVPGRRDAHLFLLAEPLAARPDQLMHVTDGDDDQTVLDWQWAARSADLVELFEGRWPPGVDLQRSPQVAEMNALDRRPGGVALTTHGLMPGRVRRSGDEEPTIAGEVELNDNGGVRLYSSHASWTNQHNLQLLFDDTVVGLTRQLVALTVRSAELGGYLGNWHLGLAVTGLTKARSSVRAQDLFASDRPFGEDVYRQALVASFAQLRTGPGTLTRRLAGPLLRAFGTRELFARVFDDGGSDGGHT